MNIFEQLLSFMGKIFKRRVFKKHAPVLADSSKDSLTWKVDWIDEQGERGTFDTQLTDLEEAEWKFNYMFDERLRIVKMYRASPSEGTETKV